MRRAAPLIALLLLLDGCSVRADMHDVAMKTARFHALLNGGKFDQIVAEVSQPQLAGARTRLQGLSRRRSPQAGLLRANAANQFP